MLLELLRALPGRERRDLTVLTVWLTAAAALHGVALGMSGVALAAVLDPDTEAGPALIGLVAVTVAFIVVQWIAQMIAFRVGSESARALHVRLGEHLADLPLGWFTAARQAQVISTATGGVPTLMSYPALLLRPALTAVVTPIAAALVLALLDWRYPFVTLPAVALGWAVSRYSGRLAADVDARRHEVSAEGTSRLLEYATRQQVIRTDGPAGGPDDETTGDELRRALDRVRDTSLRSAGTVIPGLLAFSVTLNALFVALIAVGAAWVAGADLEVSAFVGVLAVLARLSAVASTGAELASGLRLQRGAMNRLTQILTSPPLPVGDGVRSDGGALIELTEVSFRYDEAPVLDEVSFTLPRQGLTALVGPSGAGKTSLIRLIARFWDPVSGSITMDGTDLRALPPERLYAGLGTVLQDDYLLDTTIGENIRAGRPDATPEQVAAAIDAAGLTAMIADLPDGPDTLTGPAGSRLSGGQRQRVCVARALLKAAPLTLMDEATSALDPANRHLVVETAHRLARSGSVLLVAHDLETVAAADRIIVLNRGRVVQQGTPAELAGQDGLYRRLLDDHAGRAPVPGTRSGSAAPGQGR